MRLAMGQDPPVWVHPRALQQPVMLTENAEYVVGVWSEQ